MSESDSKTETKTVVTNDRPKRERKPTAITNISAPVKGRGPVVPSGSGTPLGELSYFPLMVQKYKDDDEVIRGLHSIVFSTVGTKGQRKKSLKLFNGFDSSRTAADIEAKFTQSRKKWTLNLLKEACDLLGLEKSGSRTDICKQLAEYLVSPTETKSESDVPATKSSGKKRKADSSAGPKKKKRAPSAFMIFSQAVRPQVKKENPEATFGELGKLLGAKWNELDEDEKKEWKDKAAAASAALNAQAGDEEQEEEEEEDEEEEEEEGDANGDDDEADGKDDGKEDEEES